MEGFLKIVLIILVAYFGIKWLFRLLMPHLLAYLTKKIQQKISRSFEQSSPNYSNYRQQTGVFSKNKTTSKENKPIGEYIDFEEID